MTFVGAISFRSIPPSAIAYLLYRSGSIAKPYFCCSAMAVQITSVSVFRFQLEVLVREDVFLHGLGFAFPVFLYLLGEKSKNRQQITTKEVIMSYCCFIRYFANSGNNIATSSYDMNLSKCCASLKLFL